MKWFAVLTMVCMLLVGCQQQQAEQAVVGSMAPSFTAPTLQQEQLDLAAFKGKRVMLNFWATWCGPCRDELPHMQQYYDEATDIEMIAINRTDQDYGIDKIQAFTDEYGLTFPVVLDEDGDIAKKYGVLAIPSTYFLDENGTITAVISGPLTAEQIATYMD